MKRFKKFQTIVEFSGDDLPPSSGPTHKVFRHKVYQLTLDNAGTDPKHITSQDEQQYMHDLGNVVLPIHDKEGANEILTKRFKKFVLETSLTHGQNYHHDTSFHGVPKTYPDVSAQTDFSEAIGEHHHGDGPSVVVDGVEYPHYGHSYTHYIEPASDEDQLKSAGEIH